MVTFTIVYVIGTEVVVLVFKSGIVVFVTKVLPSSRCWIVIFIAISVKIIASTSSVYNVIVSCLDYFNRVSKLEIYSL